MRFKYQKFISFSLLLTTLPSLGLATVPTAVGELQKSFNYLVNTHNNGGALYTATAGQLNNKKLPLSYTDSANFWAEYVCKLQKNNCFVTDFYNQKDYTLTPMDSHDGDLQTERVNVHNGTDIYDAATWQIAVALGSAKNHFKVPNGNAFDLINNENNFLKLGCDGNASDKITQNANRAVTNKKTFIYNGTTVEHPSAAYFFRMVTRNWLSEDPLINSDYDNYIKAEALPKDNPNYYRGVITWSDWKPITGENAWAFLLGPVQAANIHYITEKKQSYVPFNDVAIQNAINILPTFADMQSPLGGIYYVPSGTLGNQGSDPVNPHMVSVENNASLYAGLNVLKQTLTLQLNNEKDLSGKQINSIQHALKTIDVMLNGGQLNKNQSTQGLLSFFKNYAWKNGAFIQGGLANDPNQANTWVPNLEPKAVDVNTWTISALGPKKIETWFGFGAAFNAWSQVKHWGGYGQGHQIWGVGYSDQDGNGVDASGNYQQGILSSEWTAGAINATRSLKAYYQSIPKTSAHYAQAQGYISQLNLDESGMLTHVQQLRFDQYASSNFPNMPANYSSLMTNESYQPYLYASHRYMIPFGWFANPLPSTCSTSWMIMLADGYNPFQYGGKA